MKYLTVFSTLLAAAAAAPLAEEAVAQDVQEFQAEKPNLDMSANGVKILKRFSETPLKDGAKRYTAVVKEYKGVDSSAMRKGIEIVAGPCLLGNCYVTGMEATIRYVTYEGLGLIRKVAKEEANINTGAWMHHIALFGTSGSIWASGNERPTLRLNEGSKHGIMMPAVYTMIVDLMAEFKDKKNLQLEIQYEYIDPTSPEYKNYKKADVYWLTIGEPAARNGVYKFTTQTSFVTKPGKLLYAIGHMHDGGRDMRLYKNSNKTPLCTSIMHYNLRKGYTKERDEHGGHGASGGTDHISDPGACTDFGDVSVADRIWAEAWYDANAHPLMVHNGKKESLMGNMRVYIGT
jgi:hypothetical protein